MEGTVLMADYITQALKAQLIQQMSQALMLLAAVY